MHLLDAILLGVVQGVTEFLPISSSGHLILARDVLGIAAENTLAFDAVLHLATALAVIIYFFKDIKKLAIAAYAWCLRRPAEKESLRLITILLVGSIPAVIAGLLFGDLIETIFRSPFSVAGALVIGSIIMLFAEGSKDDVKKSKSVSKIDALVIGFFQALALVPGMSRSGMTISGGMLLGLSREQAARFAFLLALPVILGAGGMKFVGLIGDSSSFADIEILLLGCLAAFLSGLAAISWLMKLLRQHSLIPFVAYRVVLAVLVIVLAF